MKHNLVLVMALILQATLLFGNEPIKPFEDEARIEMLNNRQYRFYEYNHYSTGDYHVSMDLELDKSTSIGLYAFIDRVAQPSLVLEFSYDYEQVSNNLYFDSILTIISEEEQFQVIDKFPQIYGNLYNDGFFTFNFWLYHLGDDILKEIAYSKSLELKIDETYLKLSEDQIRSIQQFIKNVFLAKLTNSDIEYLGTQFIDIEYIDIEKLLSYRIDDNNAVIEIEPPIPPAPAPAPYLS